MRITPCKLNRLYRKYLFIIGVDLGATRVVWSVEGCLAFVI